MQRPNRVTSGHQHRVVRGGGVGTNVGRVIGNRSSLRDHHHHPTIRVAHREVAAIGERAGDHSRSPIQDRFSRVGIRTRKDRGARAVLGKSAGAGDVALDREGAVVGERHIVREAQSRSDGVRSREVIEDARGLESHHSATRDQVGGRGVREGE